MAASEGNAGSASTVAALRAGNPAAQHVAARIADRVQVQPDGCELWTGAMTGAGMPALTYQRRRAGLPRLVWNLLHGPLPASRVVDRTCGQQRCIALSHLRVRPVGAIVPSVAHLLTARTRVDGDCLRWTGNRTDDGAYGTATRGGIKWLAHRLVWQELAGPIPEGEVVGHHCRNLDCVRLDHLYLTDAPGRHQDVTDQGLRPAGEQHWGHLLTWDQVHHIRRTTEAATVLAARYGVARTTITSVRSYRSWRREPGRDQPVTVLRQGPSNPSTPDHR